MNRTFQAQHTLLAHIARQHAGKAPRAPRVTVTQAAVSADIGVRPRDKSGDVIVAHAGTNHHVSHLAGRVLVRNRHLCQCRKSFCRTLLAGGGNLGERHAHVIRLSWKMREDNAVRRRELGHHKVDRVQVKRVPLGQQHHHMGLPVGIGVDIGGEIDALLSRRIETLNNPRSSAPLRGHCQLKV